VPEEKPDLEAALLRLDRIIASAEADPDPAFRERVGELLDTLDAVHRQLVWRVGELVHGSSPELFEQTLLRDEVASLLLNIKSMVVEAANTGAGAQRCGKRGAKGIPGDSRDESHLALLVEEHIESNDGAATTGRPVHPPTFRVTSTA